MKIAIDFDGVIIKRKGIPTDMTWEDEPVEGALDSIKLLLEMGYKLYILTSNTDPDRVREWLKDKGFPDLRVTNIKEPSHVYIDDRALRFTNWQDIRKYFV